MKPSDIAGLSPLEAAARMTEYIGGCLPALMPMRASLQELAAELRAADRANDQPKHDVRKAAEYRKAMNLRDMTEADFAEAQTINGAAHPEQAEDVSTDSVVGAIASEGASPCRPADVAADAAAPPYTPDTVAKVVSSGKWNFPKLQWLSADHSFRVPIGTLLRAAPPSASPKPVAWRIKLRLGMGYSYVENDLVPTYECEPLYTHPPEPSEADELLREVMAWLHDDAGIKKRIRAYLKARGK